MEPSTRESSSTIELADEIRLLTGADGWRTADARGTRSMRLSDGPVGVRGGGFERPRRGALLPNPLLVASAWDRTLAERLGRLLGDEARTAGVDWVLAPMLNLPRNPLGGRAFESLSEDPELTAEIGLALIRGIQSTGVAATAKHFVANESETERLEYDARVSERTLRQRYLLPFEVAVTEGGVAAVMASYNSVNGVLATESPRLLQEILREEWGFEGAVVSDWGAARSTERTLLAGLDLVMPGPDGPWGDRLAAAVETGRVPAAAVRAAADRIAAIAARTTPGRGAAAERTIGQPAGPDPDRVAAPRALLAEAVAAGSVLLRNTGALPLREPRRIVLIGPGAAELCLQGGGSAGLLPERSAELADALGARLGAEVAIEIEPGPGIGITLPPIAAADAEAGIELALLDAAGAVLERRTLEHAHVVIEEVPPATAGARLRLTIRCDEPGEHLFSVRGSGRFALEIDGGPAARLLIPEPDRDPLSPMVEPGEHRFPLPAGEHTLALSLDWDADAEWHIMGLGHEAPGPTAEERLAAAERAAARADTVVVVVGTTAEHETEGVDRASLALPGLQDELVRRSCAANPNTVVVVNSGSPVLLPWADRAAAVLWVGFPGQEGGGAIADMLLGAVEPGGRLAMTFPSSEQGLPAIEPRQGVLHFAEEEAVGYRSGAHAAFPFGHGLGYTAWEYGAASAETTAAGGARLRVEIRNTGERTGREVVQAYLNCDGEAPRLVGFAECRLAPGERTVVEVEVPARALREWTDAGWRRRQGVHRFDLGRSSADIRATAETPAAASSTPLETKES